MFEFLKRKSPEELKMEQDPMLMSSMNNKSGYTIVEVSTGILTFALIAGGAIGLFFVLFGDKL